MRLSGFCLWYGVCAPLFGVTINSISFTQIDFTQNGTVQTAHSSRGRVSISFTQDPEGITFLNIASAGNWIVRNFPLVSTAQTGTTNFAVGKEISFGVADGTNLAGSTFNYMYSVTAQPMGAAPASGTNGSAIVGSSQQCLDCGIGGGGPSSVTPAPGGQPFVPQGVTVTKSIFHKNLGNVAQNNLQCLPGAATNSMQWLAGQNGFALNQTPTATLSEMSTDMKYNPSVGVFETAAVSGLVQFVGAHKLPLEVHYYGGGGSNNPLPVKDGYTDPASKTFVTRSGDVSWNALWEEMDKNQNVIAIVVGFDGDKKISHAITLEGLIEGVDASGDKMRVVQFRDDPSQTNGTNTQQLQESSSADWIDPIAGFSGAQIGGAQLFTMIVESPIAAAPPTPIDSGEFEFASLTPFGSCNNFTPFLTAFQSLASFAIQVKADGTVVINNNSNPDFFLSGPLNNLTGMANLSGNTIVGGVNVPLTGTLQGAGSLPDGPIVNQGAFVFNGLCTLPFFAVQIGPLFTRASSSPAIVGDPISASSGELTAEPAPDLSLGGPIPLEFRRYYESMLAYNGVGASLGNNWMSNFDVVAYVSGPSANVVTYRGAVIRFAFSSGVWKPSQNYPLGYQFQSITNGYKFLDPSTNFAYTFASNGKLTGVSDRNGNTLTITPGNAGPTSIADPYGRTLTLTYSGNNLTKIQDQSGRSVSYSFTSAVTGSSLVSFVDANGKTTSYSYSSAGPLTSLISRTTKPAGNLEFSQTYDQNGRVLAQTDGAGNTSSLVYSATVLGDTNVSDARGNTWTQSHPNLYQLTTSLDPNGNAAVTGYDANGRPASVVDRNGNTSSATYNAAGYFATRTDAAGNTTTWSYTSSVNGGFTYFDLAGIQFADGAQPSYTRDANGNVTKNTDGAGKSTSYTYDSRGQIATITNPTGGVTTYSYGQDEMAATVKSPAGDVTAFVYDGLKRLVQIKYADGAARSFTYDVMDRVLQTVDERSKITALTYTDNTRVASITDPLGNRTNITYDADDRATSIATTLGTTSSTYNQVSEPSTIKAPTGETRSFAYDKLNRLSAITDSAGQISAFTFDNEGAITSISDGANRTTVFDLDRAGRPFTTTTPLGEVWKTNFDRRNRITSTQDPLGNTTDFFYDGNGRTAAVALPGQIQASYTRDALGNVSTIIDPNGTAWNRAFDSMGRPLSRTDPVGRQTTLAYDQRNRVASVTTPLGKIQYTYDAAGRRTRTQYADGTDLSFSFDDNSRLTSANGVTLAYDANGNITNSNGLAITRDASGRIASIQYPPGSVTYSYDQRGQLSQIADWTGAKTTFTYEASLQPASITRANGIQTQFSYDGNGALIKITEAKLGAQVSSIALARDAAGRITSSNRNTPGSPAPASGLTGFTYDKADQISGATYDGNARLTKDSLRAYQWDLASRLTSYSGSDGSASFTYDGLGSRVSRTAQGSTQNYVINYATALASVAIVKNGSADQRYYVYQPDGSLVYAVDASGAVHHYYHFDESGNALFLSDDAGKITDSYGITAYGESILATGSTANPFTWQGKFGVMQESGTSLFYARARYYDSAPARFLSPDPVSSISPLRVNPYQYGLENPVSITDPTGLSPQQVTNPTNFPFITYDPIFRTGVLIDSSGEPVTDRHQIRYDQLQGRFVVVHLTPADRPVFGFEKTFLDGIASIGLPTPLAPLDNFGTGPDDIQIIVNRAIPRYANPNGSPVLQLLPPDLSGPIIFPSGSGAAGIVIEPPVLPTGSILDHPYTGQVM